MPDTLSRALADEVAKRIASGHWEVIAITGRGGLPIEVQRWCREMFGTRTPVLVVLEEAVAPPPSPAASDPHADSSGNPTTREAKS